MLHHLRQVAQGARILAVRVSMKKEQAVTAVDCNPGLDFVRWLAVAGAGGLVRVQDV
jgi:hypothetical protein